LSKARGRKQRFVRYSKEQCREGRMSKEEVKRVEQKEPARFYELTLVELQRYARGVYPFPGNGRKERGT